MKVQSRIGSLSNTDHKVSLGESFVESFDESLMKVQSRIGSLSNTDHKVSLDESFDENSISDWISLKH